MCQQVRECNFLDSGVDAPTPSPPAEQAAARGRRIGVADIYFLPTYSHQTSAEQFQQSAEFLPLRNRGLGSLAVTVLPLPLARRAAATACAAVQPTAPLFCRWQPAGLPTTGPRSALTGFLARRSTLSLHVADNWPSAGIGFEMPAQISELLFVTYEFQVAVHQAILRKRW
jgi:hypothetical protein